MITVNNNNDDNKKEEKPKQVMHNGIAHHSLTNARPPLPNPRSSILVVNPPVYTQA